MRLAGITGVTRAKTVKTTRRKDGAVRHPDLVRRDFTASGPNQLWVTDLTYVPTWAGVAYVCFITDVYSRMIVGWRVASHMRTDLSCWSPRRSTPSPTRWTPGPVRASIGRHLPKPSTSTYCCSNKPVLHRLVEPGQFTSIRYGERLAEIGAVPSIGTVGDSYDNALAETVNGYYKAELIRGPARRTPWKTVEDVELATLGWVYWHNTTRLHSYLGDLPPAEYEAAYYAAQQADPDGIGIKTDEPL